MPKGTVTIQEAIRRGKAIIGFSVRLIFLLVAILTVVLLVAGYGMISLFVVAGGILLMILYAAKKRVEWRLWAYENVADIHQLQRSAELSAILRLRSYNKIGWAGIRQAERLKSLITHFDDDQVFADDVSVPDETVVHSSSLLADAQKMFVLNNEGIRMADEEFVPWSNVRNERVAFVSYTRTSPRTGGEISAGGKPFFRFECSSGNIEYPISSMDIELWQLDLLLYIYRGRYDAKRKTTLS